MVCVLLCHSSTLTWIENGYVSLREAWSWINPSGNMFIWTWNLCLPSRDHDLFYWKVIHLICQPVAIATACKRDTSILRSPLPSSMLTLPSVPISVRNLHTYIKIYTHIYVDLFLGVLPRCGHYGKEERSSLCNWCPRPLQRICLYPDSSLLRPKTGREKSKPGSLWPQIIIISILHTRISSPFLDGCLGQSQPEAQASNKGPKNCCDSDFGWITEAFPHVVFCCAKFG